MEKRNQAAEKAFRSFIEAYLVKRDATETLAFFTEDALCAGTALTDTADAFGAAEAEIAADPAGYHVTWNRLESRTLCADCADVCAELTAEQNGVCFHLELTASLVALEGRYYIALLHSSVPGDGISSGHYSVDVERQMQERVKNEAFRLLNETVAGGLMGVYLEPGYPLYFINEQMLRYLGYTYDEFMEATGGYVQACILAEDYDGMNRQMEACLRAGDDYDVRYRLRKKDGAAIWVVERGRRVRVGADRREAAVSVCIDVTEMVELQQQVVEKAAVLAAKNRELEELTDKIPSGVQKCRVNSSGSFVYLSPGFLKITGYTREEIRRLYHDSMFEMVVEQDRERVREEFAKQAANYKKLALEYRICHKGPGELWVFNRGEIAEENGEPFFYCVILDVTDVHELKWFYKNILDSLPTALVILDEERRLTLINQSAEKLFHIRAEDCLGKTDQIGENGLDPAGGTTQEQYYLQEGRRWKLVRTPMVGSGGENRGFICAFTDVTELETLNATLQFLNDNAPGGVCEVKLDECFTLVFANEAFYHMLGYTPDQLREELENKLILLTHPDDVELFQTVIQNARECGQKSFEYEKRVHRRDGSVIWLLVRGAFTQNAGETVLSCIVIDTTERRALTEKLRMNEERLRVALEQTANVIFDYDMKRGVIEHPERSVALYGLPPVISNVPASLVEQKVCFEEDVPQFIAMYEKIQKGEPHASCVVRIHVAEGGYVWNRVSLTTLYDRDGNPVRAIGVAEDITKQKKAELLYRQEEQYRNAMLSEALLTYEIDLTQDRLYVDKDEWTRRAGMEPVQSYSKALEAVCGQVVFPEDRKTVLERFSLESLTAAFTRGETELHFEYRLKMEGGVYRWVSKTMHLLEDPETGSLKGFTYLKDIDAQKREELALKFRSERDALTGLCNKAFAEKQTRDALLDVGEDRFHALMIVDLDNFKQVNDTYGHMLGDQVLRECSRRIRYLFRDDDVVGRIGGDEFLVCLRNISTAQVAADKAAGICAAFREKFRFGEKLITLSGSVGVALFPQDGETFEELYERADLALYEAKRCGKNNYCFYEKELSKGDWKSRAEEWKPAEQPETRQKGMRGGYTHTLSDLPGQRRKTYTAVAVLLLAALLGIAALCIGYLRYFDQMIHQENREHLREVSSQVMSNIQQMVRSNRVQLESLAADIESGAVNTVPEALALMRREKDIWGYSYLALMDENGSWISTDTDLNPERFQKELEKLYVSGQETTDLLYREDLHAQFMVFLLPMEKKNLNGTEIRAIAAYCNLEHLAFDSFEGNGYAYLVHSDGTVLLGSDSAQMAAGDSLFSALNGVQLSSDYNTRQIEIDFQLQKPGFLEYNDGSAEKYLLYIPMELNDWYLVTVVPSETIGDNTRALFHSTILVVVFIAVLFSAVLLLFLAVQLYNRRRLERIAYVDPVTGGHNKRRFEQIAAGYLRERKTPYVLIYSNIDRFKLLNDRFGREAGDEVLQKTQKIIVNSLERRETCGRLMADNFGILMHYSSMETLERRLLAINRQVSELMNRQKVRFGVVMSYGVYFPDDPDEDIITMMDKANLARRLIPQHSRRLSYAVYDEQIRRRMLREKELEDKMYAALLRHEFVVFLQPKIALRDERLAGAEALVRWNDPEEGLIGPSDFIPLFEKNGFVVQIDLYVFEQVCRLIRRWLDNGVVPVPVSVNLSRASLEVPDFLDSYRRLIIRYDIPPQYLEFEFTETLVYENFSVLSTCIDEIHAMGCTCSMDDFGSGYSSLNLLNNVSVDVLKLDRAFFEADGDCCQRGNSIVEGVMAIAKSLHLKTVSEGVEDKRQVEFLKSIGCDMVQGYVFSKPLPPEEFEQHYFNRSMDKM